VDRLCLRASRDLVTNNSSPAAHISVGVTNGVNPDAGRERDEDANRSVSSPAELQIRAGDAFDFLGSDSVDEQYVSGFSVGDKRTSTSVSHALRA